MCSYLYNGWRKDVYNIFDIIYGYDNGKYFIMCYDVSYFFFYK